MPRQSYNTRPYLLNVGSLGWIEGLELTTQHDDERVQLYFGGLPYALPPLGEFRFRSPRSLPTAFRYGTKINPGRFTGSTMVCHQPGKDGLSQRDEDCLQLNIHIPAHTPPQAGWPVFFYIHGGFLQYGAANMNPAELVPLLNETAWNAIIVVPSFRLNSLGFLASKELQTEANRNGEPAGNVGLWDQRLALEWTAKYISRFGGNPDNITVGGYSAGAYSTFWQLAHELYFVPNECAIIKRIIMWSNSPGAQPKTIAEVQDQFDDLLTAFKIPLTGSAEAKLTRLRDIPGAELIRIQSKLHKDSFRPVSDGRFICPTTISDIASGEFAKRMRTREITLLHGEVKDENSLYQRYRKPKATFSAVRRRLLADYPDYVVNGLLHYYHNVPAGISDGDGDSCLPPDQIDWAVSFGKLVAQLQVHALSRSFHASLGQAGFRYGKDVIRYRLEWRAKCVDAKLPSQLGVTHTSDMAIWFWGLGYGVGLTEVDKQTLKPWNALFAAFVNGEQQDWPTNQPNQLLRLRSDGDTDMCEDPLWADCLQVSDAVLSESSTRRALRARL